MPLGECIIYENNDCTKTEVSFRYVCKTKLLSTQVTTHLQCPTQIHWKQWFVILSIINLFHIFIKGNTDLIIQTIHMDKYFLTHLFQSISNKFGYQQRWVSTGTIGKNVGLVGSRIPIYIPELFGNLWFSLNHISHLAKVEKRVARYWFSLEP